MLYIPNIVTAVPTVILDEDNSALSRQLVRDFEASDSYQVTAYVTSQEEMLAALHDQTAIAAIDIPHDFAKKARNGSYSTVLYLTNGANIILTNITSAAAQSITEDFSNHLAAQQVALRFGLNEEKVAHYIAPVVVHLHAPLGQLLLLAALFILAVIGFCFFFTSFFPAELPFVRAVILYPVPCFIFSGYTWPIESMGPNMQLAAQFFPLTHFSNTVRDLFLIGSCADYTLCLEKLCGLMLLFFLVGGLLYRRNLTRRRQAMAACHAADSL